ncbi:MAG: TIGR04283 family arsenosugar biosynthesis glycosyltransferase [Longimicrobiales bacterium]
MPRDYSIIIPTLNEAANLGRTLAAARRALGNRAEYLVVDGGSQDATLEVAREHGVRAITGVRGRGTQLNLGAKQAEGSAIVLLHADTLLPADAAHWLDLAMAEPRVVGGAFAFAFDGQHWPVIPLLKVWAHVITLRSRLLCTATGDQAIFLRRSALDQLGDLPEDPLFEDVRLVRALRQVGRFVILHAAVRTSPRLWYRVGPRRLILLHLTLRALHALGVSPRRLAAWYPANAAR